MKKKVFFARDEVLPDFSDIVVAGIDEAGRGALAGPVIAGVVILPGSAFGHEYQDSKRIPPVRRERLCRLVKQEAIAWTTGRAEAWEIDRCNVLVATLMAMQRAVESLDVTPDLVLVDGNHLPEIPVPCHAIVGGDHRVPLIAAASIIAKVERDSEMRRWHRQYPDYNFALHKGYPTREHLRSLDEYGVSTIHRRSYHPVKKRLAKLQPGRVPGQ